MRLAATLIVLATVLSGCATAPQQNADPFALSREHFSSSASVKNDPLDTRVTVTTQPGFMERLGLIGIVWDDTFLRAYVDKKSGATTFQVYQILKYKGKGWNFYQTVNFETPSGPEVAQLIVIDRSVDCTGSRYGGCTYTEHVALSIDEKLLREVASRYVPGEKRGWLFRFNARSGEETKQALLGAEVAGFLDRVDVIRGSVAKQH